MKQKCLDNAVLARRHEGGHALGTEPLVMSSQSHQHQSSWLALQAQCCDRQGHVLPACGTPCFFVFPHTIGSHSCDLQFWTTDMAIPQMMVTWGRRAKTRLCLRKRGVCAKPYRLFGG